MASVSDDPASKQNYQKADGSIHTVPGSRTQYTTIKNTSRQKITMSIYDYTGKLVYESDLDKRDLNRLTFGSDFSNGLYQLIFKDDNGRVERFRLFKSE